MATPRLRRFFLRQIYVPQDRSMRSEAKVAALAASMKEIGLKTPISIQMRDNVDIPGEGMTDAVPVLVAGLTRFRAAESLDWKEIDAFVIDGDEDDATLWECDENLVRTDLTATEEKDFLLRRADAWERKRRQQEEAAKTGGPTLATSLKDGRRGGPQHRKAFAADTQAKTGKPKSTINRALSRASVAPDVSDAIKGTDLDTGVALDTLKALPVEQQREVVAHAKAHDTTIPKAARELAEATAEEGFTVEDSERWRNQWARLKAAWDAAETPVRDVLMAYTRHEGAKDSLYYEYLFPKKKRAA